MKIAVAVILAIASAHNGINPKPTMDLDFVEIGPDAVKEDIPGADVFKKAPDGGDQWIEVTLNETECTTTSSKYRNAYKCSGSLTTTSIAGNVPVEFSGSDYGSRGKYAYIEGFQVSDMKPDDLKNMFDMMQTVSNPQKKKGGVTVKISKTLVQKIVNWARSK